jgi:hypothetical protein
MHFLMSVFWITLCFWDPSLWLSFSLCIALDTGFVWEPVTTEAGNGKFLTCIPEWKDQRWTLALVDVMELGLSITALKPVDQVTAGATCHLVFSFLELGLGEWVELYHSLSHLPVMCPRPRTLSVNSALELMPLQTVEMAEGHGFLCSMICGPSLPCSCQSLGNSDWPE